MPCRHYCGNHQPSSHRQSLRTIINQSQIRSKLDGPFRLHLAQISELLARMSTMDPTFLQAAVFCLRSTTPHLSFFFPPPPWPPSPPLLPPTPPPPPPLPQLS